MIRCHSFTRCDQQQDNHQNGVNPVVDDTITLDETDRHRRRMRLTSDNGIAFLLELDNAVLLIHDDILKLDDGRSIRVQAKPEPLYRVSGKDTAHLLHLTWHVGNRHLATQILPEHFLIRRDPVIRAMLEELGATVAEVMAGFNPVGGAYAEHHPPTAPHSHD